MNTGRGVKAESKQVQEDPVAVSADETFKSKGRVWAPRGFHASNSDNHTTEPEDGAAAESGKSEKSESGTLVWKPKNRPRALGESLSGSEGKHTVTSPAKGKATTGTKTTNANGKSTVTSDGDPWESEEVTKHHGSSWDDQERSSHGSWKSWDESEGWAPNPNSWSKDRGYSSGRRTSKASAGEHEYPEQDYEGLQSIDQKFWTINANTVTPSAGKGCHTTNTSKRAKHRQSSRATESNGFSNNTRMESVEKSEQTWREVMGWKNLAASAAEISHRPTTIATKMPYPRRLRIRDTATEYGARNAAWRSSK